MEVLIFKDVIMKASNPGKNILDIPDDSIVFIEKDRGVALYRELKSDTIPVLKMFLKLLETNLAEEQRITNIEQFVKALMEGYDLSTFSLQSYRLDKLKSDAENMASELISDSEFQNILQFLESGEIGEANPEQLKGLYNYWKSQTSGDKK